MMQNQYAVDNLTMGRQVFGTRMVYRETFCKSNGVFFSTFSAGVESMEF